MRRAHVSAANEAPVDTIVGRSRNPQRVGVAFAFARFSMTLAISVQT
jgi:hypothetical protein